MPLVKTSSIKFKTIEPSELCDYISRNPNVVLLDVRTKAEFEGKANPNFGAIKNAINLPIQELETKLDLLNAYKDKQIIVYCSHSRRSPRASYILSQNGFKNVMNMAGGMSVMNDKNCKTE
jgi:rhodanese-related sulfurtransferase